MQSSSIGEFSRISENLKPISNDKNLKSMSSSDLFVIIGASFIIFSIFLSYYRMYLLNKIKKDEIKVKNFWYNFLSKNTFLFLAFGFFPYFLEGSISLKTSDTSLVLRHNNLVKLILGIVLIGILFLYVGYLLI